MGVFVIVLAPRRYSLAGIPELNGRLLVWAQRRPEGETAGAAEPKTKRSGHAT